MFGKYYCCCFVTTYSSPSCASPCFFLHFSLRTQSRGRGEGRDERRRERMREKARNISFPLASTVCTSTYALRRFGTVLDILLAFSLVFLPLHSSSGRWRQQQHAFPHSIPFREPGLESQESNSLILRGVTQGRSLTTNEAGLFPQGEFSYSSPPFCLHSTPSTPSGASLCVARLPFLYTEELTKFL